jgi:hypothetical protein
VEANSTGGQGSRRAVEPSGGGGGGDGINIHLLLSVFSHSTVRLYAKGHGRFCRECGTHDEENFRHFTGRACKFRHKCLLIRRVCTVGFITVVFEYGDGIKYSVIN